MKKIVFGLCLLMLCLHVNAQTTQATIGITQSPFDSTFVIQTSQTDSFHAGNHPGAGPYMNAEIYLCGGAQLNYNFQPGTSSEPRFYLEAGSTLNFTQWTFAQIYAKSGSTINLNNAVGYFSIRREPGVTILNLSSSSAIMMDSVYTTINFNFPSWPGSSSPCLSPTGLSNTNENDYFHLSNPAQETLQIEYNGTNTSIRFELFDFTGRKVFLTRVVTGYQKQSIQQLPKGLYVYRVSTNQGVLKQDKLLLQ